jgi:uncharacterized membrane protein
VREASFAREIAASARQREVKRQLRHNRLRKAAVRVRGRAVPPLMAEFGSAWTAALLGCWIIALALTLLGVAPLYTIAALGLLYSGQASYYGYRLARDPGYKVPRCRCAGARNDSTETVLRSPASSIAGVPNSLLSTFCYVATVALRASGGAAAIVPVAGAAVLISVYLSYVMVFRIRALCATCVSLSALNVLILVYAV